ncbi:MAG: iron transporter [Eubacterium sp.]|nr:iron transporter [Eubacterium sp.]
MATSGDSTSADLEKLDLEDGIYSVEFNTDSTMFHVNEVYDGRGILTVKDGIGNIHIVMPSKNVVNLYLGLAEDAQKEGASLLDPSIEQVTYDDGLTEDVNAFDVPVPCLDKEFDLALIGTKAKWYDHRVSVSNPTPYEEASVGDAGQEETGDLGENEYMVPVSLEGGSGKSTIDSPTKVEVTENGYLVTIGWSSPHYDYMIVDGVKYLPVNTEGNSVFEIEFKDISSPVTVIADTTAMSKPHEIEYTLTFDMSVMD